MKLYEIIDPKFSSHQIKGDAEKFRHNMGVRNLTSYYEPGSETKAKNKLVKVLGHGVYATAVQGSNPHNVMKISRGTNDVNSDPYFRYLSSLASDDYMASNPYFPRVYKIKVYDTSDTAHKYFYVVEMEKLRDLHSISREELIYLITKIVQPKIGARVRQKFDADFNPSSALSKLSDEKLVEKLVDAVRSDQVKDPQLKQALTLADKTGYTRDITPHNLMIRRTPVGVQLVLADPIRD